MSLLGDRLDDAVRGLAPGYFAMVMATGIISIGMALARQSVLSLALLVIACVAYVVLVLLNGWRLLRHRASVAMDFRDPHRAFAFFTVVAASNVLGVRLTMTGHFTVSAALLTVGALLWLVLGYVIPWTAVLGRERHAPILPAVNGTWFIWAVASQSVAVAAAALEQAYPSLRNALALAAVFSWSIGVVLYASAGVLVAARLLLYELRPEHLIPPYWVAMGACAITVVAGARIVEMADAPMVDATRGVVAGASVFFWCFATWLIPVLLAAGWWRYHSPSVRLRYEPGQWSVIFPLGMYAVAGTYLGRADDLPIVEAIGGIELWVAFAAWAVTLVAMVVTVVRDLRPGSGGSQTGVARRGRRRTA